MLGPLAALAVQGSLLWGRVEALGFRGLNVGSVQGAGHP